ncbi:DUF1491 family protein [Novosphingobium mangrovi (ex Hu et al. 2023)]|uniref:DUF1491 family protein n=1 Tax=Novosphingobium mangrovi (ex Hu et al. 2023) TaxID=2930094 RepID=A0ABT0AB47_9SPHN|nr:DUF1491 family protein [Novosphingobium mangrovi (ex Hu et al. 2023)]MCJ1960386.1 DUF1491 family protein [Novosphingobium mangrovi (ex Hu et al. 2023)]
MDARLPAHMEVSALIRRVESEGGFGMVLSKGERDAGTLMIVLVERGRDSRAYERMPQLDGTRKWTLSRTQDPENPWEFSDFLERRGQQDPDLWIVELDIADGVRFIEAE